MSSQFLDRESPSTSFSFFFSHSFPQTPTLKTQHGHSHGLSVSLKFVQELLDGLGGGKTKINEDHQVWRTLSECCCCVIMALFSYPEVCSSDAFDSQSPRQHPCLRRLSRKHPHEMAMLGTRRTRIRKPMLLQREQRKPESLSNWKHASPSSHLAKLLCSQCLQKGQGSPTMCWGRL